MPQVIDLTEERRTDIVPPPRPVDVIQAEIDGLVVNDAKRFHKDFGIEISPDEIQELERIYGVHDTLYAIKNYPLLYREYLEDPSAFPKQASQQALFDFNHK